MKLIAALLALSAALLAITFHLPAYDTDGNRANGSVDLSLPDSWKHSAQPEGSPYGDYLMAADKTAYFTGSLTRDTTVSEKGFEAKMQRLHAEVRTINGTKVFAYVSRSGDTYRSYNYDRYLGNGLILRGSMWPYKAYATRYLGKQNDTMIGIIASAEAGHTPAAPAIAGDDWMQQKKYARAKKKIDRAVTKAETAANEGNINAQRNACTKIDIEIETMKYLGTVIPDGLQNYADTAEAECFGPLYVSAMQNALDAQGKDACDSIEVSLQTSSLEYVPKDKFTSFQQDFKQICPGRFSGSL